MEINFLMSLYGFALFRVNMFETKNSDIMKYYYDLKYFLLIYSCDGKADF